MLNTTPLTEACLKPSNAKMITSIGGYHPPTTRTGMVDTSMEATATPHQRGPNESAACSRASSDGHAVGCFREQFAYVDGTGTTGTTFTTPTAPKVPTTGDGTGSTFVANHETCRVSLYRYLENKPVCNTAVYYCAGHRLETKVAAVDGLAEKSL